MSNGIENPLVTQGWAIASGIVILWNASLSSIVNKKCWSRNDGNGAGFDKSNPSSILIPIFLASIK